MSGDTQIVRMIIESVFGAILHKADKQKPIKGYRKTTTFKGRGGAWFLIGISVFCITLMLWGLAAGAAGDIEGDSWWGYALIIAFIVFMLFHLRYSISMLKAKIIVGPEMLVLDGANEVLPGHGFKQWLRKEFISLVPSDLIVELPWADIHCIVIKTQRFQLPTGMIVETKSHERFSMNIWYFDMNVVKEIKKYYPKTITH